MVAIALSVALRPAYAGSGQTDRATIAPAPAWNVALDVNSAVEPKALVREGLIVAASSGGMCAFAFDTGRKHWCARGAIAVAYESGVVAYATSDGNVRGLAARTGRQIWNTALAPRALLAERGASAIALWPGRSSFLVNVGGSGDPATSSYAELEAADGRILWHGRILGASGPPVLVGSHAIQRTVGSGATMVFELQVIALGRAGGPRWSIRDGDAVLGGDARALIAAIATRDLRPPDVFASADVAFVDIVSQRVLGIHRLTPNPRWAEHDEESGHPIHVHANARSLIATYGGNLYRYRVNGTSLGAPSVIPGVDEYLGMAGDAMVVRRPDGIWLLAHDGTKDTSWRASGDAAAVSSFASGYPYVYVTLADGPLIAVDVRTRQAAVFPSCRSAVIIPAKNDVAVVCRERTDRRVLNVYHLP